MLQYRTLKKISAGQFYVYRVPIKLGKVIKSEKKNNNNRRVAAVCMPYYMKYLIYDIQQLRLNYNLYYIMQTAD